jgi:rare lipoprotein A
LRPKCTLRNARPIHVIIATTMLAAPASAVALTAGDATPGSPTGPTSSGSQTPLKLDVSPRRIQFGDPVTVTGVTPAAEAGRTLRLDAAATRHSRWRTVAATRIGRDGRFRLVAALRTSGFVKVLDATAGLVTPAADSAALAGTAAVPASAPHAVLVAAELRAPNRSFNVLDGQAIDVRGTLRPGLAGRAVHLQGRSGRGWRELASARTGPRGGFHVHFIAGDPAGALGAGGSHPLRVVFSGDRANTRARRRIGQMAVYQQSVASWYDDAGGTASGFHANFGVANRTLPFGTRVTFRYGGRSVTAVVDDRGPFVGGRDWDFNQNTAAALRFGGVGTVWSTM